MPVQPTVRYDFPSTFRVPGAPRRQGPSFIGSTDTSGARSLTNQLASLNPALQNFLGAGFDFYREQERAKGEEFARNNKGTYAEAVRKGDLPAGASVFFREAVVRSEVENKGRSFNAWLQSRWMSDPNIKGADEETFERWLEAQTSDYSGRELSAYNASVVSEEFGPLARQAQQNLAVHHIADGFKRTRDRGLQALQDGVLSVIREVETTEDIVPFAERLAAEGVDISGLDADEIRTQYVINYINRKVDEAYNVGIPYADSNRLVTDAVELLAMESGDTAVLEVGDHIKAGTGPLGNTLAYREMALRTSARIAAQKEAQGKAHENMLKEQKEAHYNQMRLDMWRLAVDEPQQLVDMVTNYGGDDPEELEIMVDALNAFDIEPRGGTDHEALLGSITADARMGRFEPEEILDIQKRERLTKEETSTLLRINDEGRRRVEVSVQNEVSDVVDQLETVAQSFELHGISAVSTAIIARERRRLQNEVADLYDQDKPPTRQQLYQLQDASLQRGLQALQASQDSGTTLEEQAAAQPTIEPTPEVHPTVETDPTPQQSRVQLPNGSFTDIPVGAIEAHRQHAGDPAHVEMFDKLFGAGASAAVTQ